MKSDFSEHDIYFELESTAPSRYCLILRGIADSDGSSQGSEVG